MKSDARADVYVVSLLVIFKLTQLVVTLRPSNVQASLGFQQCMTALKDMEVRFGL